ncbi:alpha-ketoglutarate-dependent dioxygenase AlkB family protein [Actinokineospora globicatena]|uniref:alpha-ketoglutarate-dependent dioxygenase AlkB family protein n=1 Tax=Actinokineospora globicatena TaxID=103729 RepID=UPI0020A29305|nr:alpha-ketoglutarate-dependent dioxygenase AlkB [Actinokineospora globicatena]MCP2302333.1 alkylated DNA repair protein (DNA oxidative demethylase) [Actinokineospora globicatena]GLW75996.1 alkylated DNA repair protein [Actinokineospora globicatena]GLW82835.1 alkylated DNA repair protein [Actinokineospora globicatena]
MELIPRPRLDLAPGAVHLPDWLDLATQRDLLAACREWAPGMRQQRLPNGGVMSVRMVCLGWHWVPYRYTRVLDDGTAVLPFPEWLGDLGRRAVAAAGFAVDYRPDIALVNFYDADARMGLHQDKDERSMDPVVSFSLGDTGVFRFGNTENRGRPWTDVDLRSGDLVVFGGESRLAYHGVTKIRPGTADPDLGLSGRLNITLRVSGMD